jgi:hypothetical protein
MEERTRYQTRSVGYQSHSDRYSTARWMGAHRSPPVKQTSNPGLRIVKIFLRLISLADNRNEHCEIFGSLVRLFLACRNGECICRAEGARARRASHQRRERNAHDVMLLPSRCPQPRPVIHALCSPLGSVPKLLFPFS